MATSPKKEAADNQGAASSQVTHRRARPSPTEHARRVAWGKKWGALVAAAYRREQGRQVH